MNPEPDSSSQLSQKNPHPFSPSIPQRSPSVPRGDGTSFISLGPAGHKFLLLAMGVGEGGSILLGAPLLRRQLPVSRGSASLLRWKIFAACPAGVWRSARVPPCLRGKARWEDTVKTHSGLCCLHGNFSRFPFPFCPFGGMFKVTGCELTASVPSLLPSRRSYQHMQHQHLPLGNFCGRRSLWSAKAGTTSEVGCAPPQ